MKPELIVHPGFPKCATSSIQSLFSKQPHAVAKALRLSWIGANFRPDNGYPSVSKLMYDYDACVADIASTEYLGERYFMSNEAIQMHPKFIAVLKERFNITRAVYTIRFPITQSVSSFRYSGWLTSTFAEFVKSRKNSFSNIDAKYGTKRLCEIDESPRLVPVEGPEEMRFEERFCQAAFDEVPSILSEPPFSNLPQANQSPPLAFADALAREMKSRGTKIPGPDRNRVVSAAKTHPLPDELRNLGGPQIGLLTRMQMADCLNEYQSFLVKYGIDRALASAARSNAEASCLKLLDQVDPTPGQLSALEAEARRLLDSIL